MNTIAIEEQEPFEHGYAYRVLSSHDPNHVAVLWRMLTGGRDVILTEDLHIVEDTLLIGERWRAEEALRHVSESERFEVIASLLEIGRALSRG